MNNKQLSKKILDNQRITEQEALQLFDFDLAELGFLADTCRKNRHPSETVGFIIDRIINYCNTCEAACDFCAFHARAGQVDAYELSLEEIMDKVDELAELDGSQVMLQGGLNSAYAFDFYTNLLSMIKKAYPDIFLHSFSPAEIYFIARIHSMSIDEVILQFKQAGLDSVPGASDLLVDTIRNKISPDKISKDNWCEVMRSLKNHDLFSSATMTYGFGESNQDRIEHLSVIRNIQDETGIIRAFIPWSFSPQNTKLKDTIPATGVDYLRIVAVARIFLDNVQYIQAGWLTEGLKLAQLALCMGANDMGGVLMEEVVVKATGIQTNTNIQELVAIIRNTGKKPVLRDSTYTTQKEF